MKIGVVGLTHTHVHGIFNSAAEHDRFVLAGVVEPDRELAARYAEQYAFPMDRVYATLEELIESERPDAVTAFGSIYDHLEVVRACAPRGIHVMVEKPLAVSADHAREMAELAEEHGIHLLTNYETTWYSSTHAAYRLAVEDTAVGPIRKVIVRDGHRGPKKIGVDPEFLEWLTDPELNGGGAIIDFGCYGANLLTWLLRGEAPNSVTAITRQLQPRNNPLVDDEAIIILNYDSTVALLQPSWNWPIGRKDMEIYGVEGAIYADNRHELRLRLPTGYDTFIEDRSTLPERPAPYHDPFVYFAAVVNGEVNIDPYDLSALENNLLVVRILDAAVRSAREGKTIVLDD